MNQYWEIGTCDVCWLIENDERQKPVLWCNECQSYLCEFCMKNKLRRARAAVKRFFRRMVISASVVLFLCIATHAQTPPPSSQFELYCSSSASSPMPPNGWTLDPSTNKYRAWVCVDANGNVTSPVFSSLGQPSTFFAYPTGAQTVPITYTNTCPTSGGTINPVGAIQKSDGNYYAVAGIDTTTIGPLPAPHGTFTWCQQFFFNDTGTLPMFTKNNEVSVFHQFEAPYLGVGSGNDDRAIGIRAQTLSSITGSNHARFMGIYGELGINGAPTAFAASPDFGALGVRWTIDDSRTGGTLLGSPMIALDGSYQDTTSGGASAGSCGFTCAVGVRGVASSVAGGNGAGTYTGGYFQAQGPGNGGGSSIGYSLFADGISNARFVTENIELGIGSCSLCNSTIDWGIWSPGVNSLTPGVGGTVPNLLAGWNMVGDLYAANSGTIAYNASLVGAESISTAQLNTPVFSNGNITVIGTSGSTTWSYKIVFRDQNGGVTAASAVGTITTGNATLNSSNYNDIFISLPSPAPAFIDIYRTASGGTPSTTGKISTFTVAVFGNLGSTSYPGQSTSQFLLVADQGLAGDGSTPPAANSTGAVKAYGYQTLTDCNSALSPAVCGSASAGSVVVAATATTVTINTTAVGANSEIFLTPDDTLGTKLGVTCNSTLATLIGGLAVTARSTNTSFQVTSGVTPAINPLCFSYDIRNPNK